MMLVLFVKMHHSPHTFLKFIAPPFNHTQNLIISFFTSMNFKTNIPPNEKRTPEPTRENPHDPLRGKQCLHSLPSSPADLPFSCLPLKGAEDSVQTLHLPPGRWSHPPRPTDPGKRTGSGASTGKAADGKVKNIPRERQHPLRHRIMGRGRLLLAAPHQPPAQTSGNEKALPTERAAGKKL